ncbi:hypothetical protein M3Y99_00027100 [Aphelenchoides fujianensis]|nr:hypothetical protein M3Y99_00027100 [Aphelenchoides fujianensis]
MSKSQKDAGGQSGDAERPLRNPFDDDDDEEAAAGRPFNAETARQMDEFVLGTKRNAAARSGDAAASIGAAVMHRRAIAEEAALDDEVDGLELPVHAYNADRLESGLIRQAEDALDAAQEHESPPKKKQKDADAVQNVLQTRDAVKHGDRTPFEIMIQKQKELERQQTEKRQEKRIAELQRKLRPSAPSRPVRLDDEDFAPPAGESDEESSGSGEWITDDEDEPSTSKKKRKKGGRSTATGGGKSRKAVLDDGNEEDFLQRMRDYHESQRALQAAGQPNDLDANFHDILHGYKVSSSVWQKLYKYQKTGVRWLHQLHEQYVGGILADEMGLGKTIQVAVLLRSIAESRQYSRIFDYHGLGPTLIIAPATLMHQWVRELRAWFPKCRAAVFHSSGSFSGSKKRLLQSMATPRPNGTVLITSYSTYTLVYKDFLKVNWHYVILDEGHKIPQSGDQGEQMKESVCESGVTTSLKELRTPHRLLLTGSPMQNNLKELWSLIDFVYPGRLGSLKEFTDKFANPITQGGYANATKIQVRTAFKCACLLRDAINPYMLRRMKKDVEMVLNLPEKSEQVLFCDITEHQRELYKEYISSKEIRSILVGKLDAFVGLITLRKLCNHPDLITGGPNRHNEFDTSEDIEQEFGAACRSGKMMVVDSLLKLWFKQGHKVLLFSQSKQMLTILEKLVIMKGYGYLRMDGGTPIGSRPGDGPAIQRGPGAVRLPAHDAGGRPRPQPDGRQPDCHLRSGLESRPVDSQARERAWRIGQSRNVTVYRLMSSGTIEEKIYQRQIFKQFLANRILVDPKQKRFFKTNDLQELFTLGDERTDLEHGTETAAIFSDQPTEINKKNFFDERAKRKEKEKKSKERKRKKGEETEDEEEISDIENVEITLTDEYKEELRQKAREYVRKMAEQEANGKADEPPADVPSPPINQEEGEVVSGGEQPTASPAVSSPLTAESKADEEAAGSPAVEQKPKEKKRKKKHKEKKSKKRLLDGKFEIRYLRKQRDYRSAADAEGESSRDQDDYVLGHLLKNTGVHSALRHDQILGETAVDREDMQLVEEEAEAVARRAAEVLKRSHRTHKNFVQLARTVDAAEEEAKKKRADEEDAADQLPSMFNGGMRRGGGRSTGGGALSSAELSTAIKQRRMEQLEDLTACDDEANADPETRMYPSLMAKEKKLDVSLGDKYEGLAEEVRLFFVANQFRATSNEVVAKFKKKVPPQDSFVFRSILRRLCLQLPNSHWALREEFR